jgi:hypothetical protein
MVVRTSLITSNDIGAFHIYELNATDTNTMHDASLYVYSNYTGVTLSVVGSGGTLSGLPMTDTRYQAGASTTDVTNFDTAAETPDISVVTVNYSRLTQTVNAGAIPPDTSNLAWPIYFDGTDFRAMNSTDFYDTFVAPALSRIQGDRDTATYPAGSYFVSTSTTVVNASLVSATPIFTDTRANAAAYTAGGIPEVRDQPTTINNYYLHRAQTSAAGVDVGLLPLYVNAGDENIYQHTLASWTATLGPWLQYYTNVGGSGFRYNVNPAGPGTIVGTTMVNTILNGSSAAGYTQRFVNANDYRTQEFPNGTAVVANTYALRRELI